MFYDKQPELNKENYRKMLEIIGSLSNLFSDSNEPFLQYRAHENCFCKFFEAENRGRDDSSADATKDDVGIGLKTWVGRDDQKVAEFGELRPTFENLSGIELVRKIAEYRNERIRVTKNQYGLQSMLYHVVKRIPHAMQIYECAFDYIDIENLSLIAKRGGVNNTYFTDGKHVYHFSKSKNTLYMIFDGMMLLDQFDVNILDDPYALLMKIFSEKKQSEEGQESVSEGHKFWFLFNFAEKEEKNQLCLRLYAVRGNEKFVPEKSGLNQWNASGRPRDWDEIYIPYLTEDRERKPNFFPPKDTCFNLKLPDGKVISAKVCQNAYSRMPDAQYALLSEDEKRLEDERRLVGKAIMSNPNKELGHWLLRDVFELKEGTLVTYEMLQVFNIDSVMFTKIDELNYEIDFCPIGTYENSCSDEDQDRE